MTVQHNADRWDKSNVLFRDGVIVEYNKRSPRPDMAHIDYGLGAFDVAVLAHEGDAFDLSDVYHRLSLNGDLAGFEAQERFYEIGSHRGLMETEQYFKAQEGLT
jgi:hypothetical protein